MKYCSNCGAKLNDEDMVCTACNAPQPQRQPVAAPAAPVSNESVPYTAEAATTGNPIPQAPPQKKTGLLVLLVVAVALGLIVLIGALTDWFGLITPMDKLIAAVKDTLTAENFTVNLSEYRNGELREDIKIKAVVDEDNKDIILWMEDDDLTILYHDGREYTSINGSYANVRDVDDFYGLYENTTNFDDIDWDDIIDELELDKLIDADNVPDFLTSFYTDYIDNADWMEDSLGFEVNGNVYTFKPDMDDVVDDILDLAQDKDIIKSKYKDEIEDDVDDLKEDLDDIDDLTIQITLDGGYISKIVVEYEENDRSYEYRIKFSDVNETEITEGKINDFIDEVEKAVEEDACPDCGSRMWGREYCWNCCDYCDFCGDLEPDANLYNVNGETLCGDCVDDLYFTVAICCEGCGEIYYNTELLDETYCKNCATRCEICSDVVLKEDVRHYAGYDMCLDCYWDY